MRRHLLRELPPPTIAQVLSDSCRPERVIADSGFDSRLHSPPADHSVHIGLGEGVAG